MHNQWLIPDVEGVHRRGLFVAPSRTNTLQMRLASILLLILLSSCRTVVPCGAGPCQSCPPETCSSKGCKSWCCHPCHHHDKYCRFSDNLKTKCAARWWARADLRKMADGTCLSCDFRYGFEQAYVDVALGASGAVPALPPADYWKRRARTPAGHQRAQEWFSGYSIGVSQAVSRYGCYNQVAASGVPGYEFGTFDPAPGPDYSAPYAGGEMHYGQ